MVRRLQRSNLKHYLVSALGVAVAAVLTLAIRPFFGGKAPLFFFTIVVILSASYGGLGTGLLATALSIGIVVSVFREHVLVMAHSSLALFALIGVVASVFIERLHRVNAALARSKIEAEDAKEKMSEHAEALRRVNEKLSERTEALFKTNEELQRFAYALAHDLHTPLRGISTLTDLLVRRNTEKLDESSKECAALIVAKIRGMQSLIQGLLDYAAAVDKPDERVAMNLNQVVARAIQDVDSAIEATNARITWDALPVVYASESLLVRVFSNLIGNGVKYCPKGRTPEIHISAAEQKNDWVFCVRDNGIGLEIKYAEDIFGIFKRLHSSGEFEGSGIGLALCKMVIQRYGGRIWVESEVGKGSRFLFTLPKATEGAEQFADERTAGEGPSPSGMRAAQH
jgi:signal transduction histidine kinase